MVDFMSAEGIRRTSFSKYGRAYQMMHARGEVAFPAVQPQRVTQPVVLPLPQRSLRPAYARAS
jgi:hypothetical protein